MRYKMLSVLFFGFILACAHLKQAHQSFQDQDYKKTIHLCKIALQKDSTDKQALLLLSRSYLAMDSTAQSIQTLNRLQALNPDSKCKSLMASLYFENAVNPKNRKNTLSLLLKAEELDSAHIAVTDTLASIFYAQGDYPNAKLRYNRLIDLAKNPMPYMNLVNKIENRQAYATDEFEKGMAALKGGNNDAAEDHLSKAVRADPHFAEAVYQYGMLAGNRLYRKGSQDALSEAISVLRNAANARPKDIEAHYLLARACERKGQSALGEAIEHYRIVLNLSPKGQYAKTCKQKIEKLKKRKAFWDRG